MTMAVTSNTTTPVVETNTKPYQPMSLTPESRNREATDEAMSEGLFYGALTLIPSATTVGILLKRAPKFAARTNWQSRTAIAIMPALFVTAFTAEKKLEHKMKEIAQETRHSNETVQWAERQLADRKKEDMSLQNFSTQMKEKTEQEHLRQLYRESLTNSDVCIVPGDSLSWYHKVANFTAANPLKVLAGIAVPSVAWIFYGNSGKEHLDFSVKIMHTRVFGQFATLSLLLGVVGFKEFMDKNGRFISQAEAEERVEEMARVREALQYRLKLEREQEEKYKQAIAKAHVQDAEEGHVATTTKKKRKKAKKQQMDNDMDRAVNPIADEAE